MQKTTKGINTYCPVFNGFYNSIWEYEDNCILDDINENRQVKNIEFEHLEIDYKQHENNVALSICEHLKTELSEYVENIVFESIWSPKEYNFRTDVINCIITPKVENIQKFIFEHQTNFKQYLKDQYTSYDGFLSAHSNSFDQWKQNTADFSNFDINGHYLGSILQFICNELEIDNCSIYNSVEIDDNFNYITNWDILVNAVICTRCNKIIEDKNILKKYTYYVDVLKLQLSKVLCIDCLENI